MIHVVPDQKPLDLVCQADAILNDAAALLSKVSEKLRNRNDRLKPKLEICK